MSDYSESLSKKSFHPFTVIYCTSAYVQSQGNSFGSSPFLLLVEFDHSNNEIAQLNYRTKPQRKIQDIIIFHDLESNVCSLHSIAKLPYTNLLYVPFHKVHIMWFSSGYWHKINLHLLFSL